MTTISTETTTRTVVVWEVVEYPSLEDAIDWPAAGRVIAYTTDQWHAHSGDWPIQDGYLIARPVRVAVASTEHQEAVAAAAENCRLHEATVPTIRGILLSAWDAIIDGARARRSAQRTR